MDKENKTEKNQKITIDSLCKQIKVMRPGAVMQFIAKQLGMNSAEFAAKYALKIAKMALKNGWVKTKDIGASIADFTKKNKKDVTGIDFSKAEIDPSTTKFKCLFDNVGDKFSTFMKDIESELKDEGKEIEKADEQLHADVKKAGVKMDEQEIDDNGLAVASVIDDKKNKGKSGKELKKEIEGAIEKDKQAKEIQKISKELKKTSSKVKVDKKYEKMSDEELAKLDDKINKKIRNRSEASKKNDAFRSKIKNAVQKGVAEDFKKSVKTIFVNTSALKKTIAKNMKPGLAVDNIEEPRAICIFVQCSKKEFGNVLKEAKDKDDSSAKIIDVTNGSKDKSIQKVIDYIKKVLQDNIGKDKLGKKIYAYLKNVGSNCLLYVFAGVKQDELNENLLNESNFKSVGVLAMKDKAAEMQIRAVANIFRKNMSNDDAANAMENWLKDNAAFKKLPSIKRSKMLSFLTTQLRDGKKIAMPKDINIDMNQADFEDFYTNGQLPSNINDSIQGSIKDIANISQSMPDEDTIKKAIGAGGEKLVKAGKNSREMASALKGFAPKDEEEAMKLAAKLAKGGANELAAQDAVRELCKRQEWFNKLDSDAVQELKDKLSVATNDPDETLKFTSGAAAKAADAATDVASTTADTASDTMNSIPSFNYHDINTELRELNNVFSDGKIDADEMQKIAQFGDKLNSFSKWAAEHQNINNPFVQAKIAEIKALSEDYHGMLEDNKNVLDSAAAAASDARTGATEATRAASKEIANDEEVKKAAGGWKEKLGLGKAFTALGWARLAAKTTGIILNNGKAVIDALGAAAVKFKEDANVIAQMNFLLTNGDGNDTKFQDSKFSVRFSVDDMKWHATCLDDRKMKFDEDELIKKALDSEEGKKFKAACLKKWTSIFKPKDETREVIPYIMKNFEKIGLKASDSNVNKIIATVQKMDDDFGTIEKQFK